MATNYTLLQAQAQTLIPTPLHNYQYQHPLTFTGQPPRLLVTQQPQPISIQYVPNSKCTEIFKETNKPTVLNSSAVRYTGSLKFFDENKGFGFIARDVDSGDIFLHSDDLLKANLDLKLAMEIKAGKTLRMSFCVLEYLGKYNRSKKAVDIKLIEYEN
jgi:hypothetical protein